MTECFECRENDKMLRVSMLYSCGNDFCVNYINPVFDEAIIAPLKILKIYKTLTHTRKAINKYQTTHKIESKAQYHIRRQIPDYVLHSQNLSSLYRQKNENRRYCYYQKMI